MVRYLFMLLFLAQIPGIGAAAEISPDEIQEKFNRKYQDYLRADSQMLLPFPKLEAHEWKKILETRLLKQVYSEPGKYYNNKVYTFTLFQDVAEDSYFLDAKGGFWGMDELFYGPLLANELGL